MSTIKCPECKLVNLGSARTCRRCATPLIPDGKGRSINQRSSRIGKLVCGLAIAVTAVVLAFWIYGPNRKEHEVLTSETAVAGEKSAVQKIAPVRQELEEAKELSSIFVARMDQNLIDRNGHGFENNQALASDTLKIVREQMPNVADPEAQKHLEEFSRLLEQYYDQLATYNADTTTLAASSRRMKDDIEQVQQDSTLSPDEKSIRQREIQRKYLDESQEYNGTSKDIDATMESLRALVAGS